LFGVFHSGFCDIDPLTMLTESQRQQVSIALSIGLIVLGVIMVLFGHRMSRPLINAFGSFVVMITAWFVIRLFPGYQSATITLVIRISVVLVLGILGGLLAMLLYKAAIFLFGGMIGVLLGATVLAIGIPGSPLFHYLWCFAFGFAGGILSLIWEDILVLFGSALLGSVIIGTGLDQLVFHSGFSTFINEFISQTFFLQSSPLVFVKEPTTFWIIFSGVLVVFLLGCIIQFKYTANLTKSPLAPNLSKDEAIPLVEIQDI